MEEIGGIFKDGIFGENFIDRKFDTIFGDSFVDRWFDKKMNNVGLAIKDKIGEVFSSFFEVLLAVVAIGIVFYMLYQIIRFMFLGKNEDFQKIIFSTFLLILTRVLTVILVSII